MATGLNTRDDDTLRALADSLSDSGLEAAVERMAELLKRRHDARGYISRPLPAGNYAAGAEVGGPGAPMGETDKLAWVFQYHDNPSLTPQVRRHPDRS